MTKVAIISLTVCMALFLAACGTSTTTAQSTTDVHRYFDGTNWHTLHVQLNQLHVERQTTDSTQPTTEIIMLRHGVGSYEALADVAQQMRDAQANIINISIFVSDSQEPHGQPERVTNKLAVQIQPDVQFDVICSLHNMRVIEKLTYAKNTYLCEVQKTSMIASLIAAEKIQAEPGVIFAMPLQERARVRK